MIIFIYLLSFLLQKMKMFIMNVSKYALAFSHSCVRWKLKLLLQITHYNNDFWEKNSVTVFSIPLWVADVCRHAFKELFSILWNIIDYLKMNTMMDWAALVLHIQVSDCTSWWSRQHWCFMFRFQTQISVQWLNVLTDVFWSYTQSLKANAREGHLFPHHFQFLIYE